MEKVKKLISEKIIKKRIKELGKKITRDYKNKKLVVIGILKGSFIFMSDLIREIKLPLNLDFVIASSYGKGKTPGKIKLIMDIKLDIKDKDVLLVEDIIDTGKTVNYLIELFKKRKPRSIRICSLLDKPSRRIEETHIDYLGFVVPNKFVVGYGIDFNENYRNLPFIGYI
jgi:hypoxanthine phosphoribosyltransferase